MDKNAYLLGKCMNKRDSIIRLSIASQVVNTELFKNIRASEPLVASLMLNKFKEFLDDVYFSDIERQIILVKFLRNETDIDTIRNILNHINNCALNKDYEVIAMEWNLKNSDFIRYCNLEPLDGLALSYTKEQNKEMIDTRKEFKQHILDTIMHINNTFLENVIICEEVDDEED